jgi:polygalacturonase
MGDSMKIICFTGKFLAFCICMILYLPAGQSHTPGGWEKADEILTRIKAPAFPAKDFTISDFGAIAGGKDDCTSAIRKAIDACSSAGGGRVVIPMGIYLTGAIHLQSNVNLHLVKGATLLFTTDPGAYLPVVFTRWEGIECMNYSPFIYAFNQKNIAVTGEGTLDGGASENDWWAWALKDSTQKSKATPHVKLLNEMSEKGVPVEKRIFGEGYFLRPNFFVPYRCQNVLIEGVTILRSPMWEVNPVLCTNVIVRGLKIMTHGPNNDGCDPESCRDVLIENCLFDAGDDCIAIKSGRNDDGRRVGVPSENLIIRGCTMKEGHAGVAIGSEIAGGCRNVFIENCALNSPILDRALRIKSNARRGGVIDHVFMRNVNIGEVAEALLTIDFLYEEGPNGSFPPSVTDIVIENVTSQASPRLFFINGFKGATIDRIRVANSVFHNVTASEVIENTGKIELENVTIEPKNKTRSRNSRLLVK